MTKTRPDMLFLSPYFHSIKFIKSDNNLTKHGMYTKIYKLN